MNRHELRLKMVFSTYQHLLLNKPISSTFLDSFDIDLEDGLDEYASLILNDLKNHEQAYIEEISKHLVKWSFNRLSYIDQAVLLISSSELRLAKNDRAIIIDEALKIIEQYSEESSKKYINGVLDKL